MSGHSHWATIRRAKSANDAKRGKLWSKLARRIIVAAKTGGGNPEENLTLRYSIDDAKAANMPKDTINKAIKKGTGELGGQNYEQVIYEGYGPDGVAFMVDCLTDNRNRTAPEMRKIFERGGGQLGASNCVAWMFESKGTFVISADQADEDALMEIALDAGADDMSGGAGIFEITCKPQAFSDVRRILAEKGIETISSEIALVSKNTISVGLDRAKQILNLMESFEDHDDVQNVFANFEMDEETVAKLSEEDK